MALLLEINDDVLMRGNICVRLAVIRVINKKIVADSFLTIQAIEHRIRISITGQHLTL